MKMKIGVIGPLNIDLIMRGKAPTDIDNLNKWAGPSDIHCLTAGAVGYFVQNFHKLGAEIALVSTIGDDPFGDMILTNLQSQGIQTKGIVRETSTLSAIGIYILLFGSNKRPLTFRLPTHHGFPPHFSKSQREMLLRTDLIHCGGFLHFSDLWKSDVAEIFAEAKKKGIITSFDPQFPLAPLDPPWKKVLLPVLKNVDILLVDENEAMGITGTTSLENAVPELLQLNIPKIVIKMGERGIWAFDHGEKFTQSAFKVSNFIDSIGAGDSFDAGFLYSILQRKTMKDAIYLGAYVAAKSCEGVGGTSTFPTEDQLNKSIITFSEKV
jgi:sugar/nucleoside kinase (ribokinase family)